MPRFGLLRGGSLAETLNRAIFALTLGLVLLNVYRRVIIDTADPYKCKALLNHGQWLDSPERSPEHKPWFHWQPPGCLLHEYNISDIAGCSEGRKMLFVGDSTMRQVFWATARMVQGRGSNWVAQEQNKPDTHADLVYSNNSAHLKFLWDPWLNSSALHDELKAFRARKDPDHEEQDLSRNTSSLDMASRRSMVILVGGGLWHARHLKEDYLPHFKASVDFIASAAYPDGAMTDLADINSFSNDGIGDQIFFAPVIEPEYDELSPSREITITPEKIDTMNSYLQDGSLQRGMNVLWSYTNLIRGRPDLYGTSGIHVIDRAASRMADIVLNLRCNAKAARGEGYPFERTCCSAYRPTTLAQIAGWLSGLALILATTRLIGSQLGTAAARSSSNVLFAFATIMAIVCYCFIADRTQIFDKMAKEFFNFDFRLLLGLAVLVCLSQIRGSPSVPIRSRSGSRSVKRQPFLPRAQSDEFKGWMQVYILVYGYTNSAGELDFYQVNRVFLALYLFLSGYGHSMYFLQTNDYSLQRVATVLLRLNILPAALAIMMDRPYTTYYFAPLVSFWFLIVYLTLGALNSRNSLKVLFLAKLLLSSLLVTFFIHIPGILEFSVSVLGITCRADIDVDDWRLYLGTDKYIVFVGMFVAYIHLRISTLFRTPRTQLTALGRLAKLSFGFLRLVAICFALVAIPGFWITTRKFRSRNVYDMFMPYMTWLPVLGFVILRNATVFVRTYHSAGFAWLGRISLELYVLSNHIWLAGDGRGLLKIGLRGDGTFVNDRWRDLIILTPIFIWMAWIASNATKAITAWMVGAKLEQYEGEDIAMKTHGRATGESAFPDCDNALPHPSTQQRKKSDFATTSVTGVGRRVMVAVAVVWVLSLLR
ncbi:Cas1p-domain-containing protein [Corynespora cassiicola Philippines]|uniref:Cas1p-domain-containing protein n=1 Tax=Corynespora cassiicola Philippines TaxID=1448308 RepID=A0A2T2PA85_CORCC|nr:Cas1p-domain-containing protein [Corynespora cassiicola Philippines]